MGAKSRLEEFGASQSPGAKSSTWLRLCLLLLGQGHLSRFLSFGLGLPVTAVEGNRHLVDTAKRFDRELVQALEKERARGGKVQSGEGVRGHGWPPQDVLGILGSLPGCAHLEQGSLPPCASVSPPAA